MWHFAEIEQYSPEEPGSGLFTEYIDTFLKLKQEASGYPPGCETDQQKRDYILDYAAHEHIQLDPANIRLNNALRCLAKIALNAFWGEVGGY